MKIFSQLSDIIGFERRYLPFIETIEDRDIAALIGYHDVPKNSPLTVKQLFLLNVGSIATVQRRLTRLVTMGIVQKKRDDRDRRMLTLHLTPDAKAMYQRYEAALSNGEDNGFGERPKAIAVRRPRKETRH